VIETFKSKALKEVHESGKSRHVRQDQIKKIDRLLDTLSRATKPQDMNVPGFDFHELKGDRKGTFTVHVNGPWCITFSWEDGSAIDVDLEQYH
jgi:proteic killer suppression protein